MEIKKIKVSSLVKILTIMYAALGLIVGIFVTLGSLVAPKTGGSGSAVFGVAAVILLPILYAIIGAIGGALAALIYNLVSRKVGGIVIEAE